MTSKDIRPKWWQLYLTLPVLIALFVVEARLRFSTRGHQVVQIAIVLLVYGLIHLWLKANRSALARMDWQKYGGKVRIIQISSAQLPNSGSERRSILQLSDSEIQGLLTDTMDRSYIDADSISIDELHKN